MPMKEQNRFVAGSTVRRSGTYKVNHGSHLLPPLVYVLKGQRFPKCSKHQECEDEVVFTFFGSEQDGLKWQMSYAYELPVMEDGECPPGTQTTVN
jgi:hypothetical protein